MELIDKFKLLEELKKCEKICEDYMFSHKDAISQGIANAKRAMCQHIIKIINTLEVKEVGIWHLQEKEDIYDAVKDWGLYTFVCIMKDGTIQKFIGNLDEDYEGHINVHINGINDDYDNVDDIVKWIEFT